jgi:RND family efflux transporter MFP subunit
MTPRLRNDLQAVPLEEQGIKYFDVSDPRSGARMRMYDFEWLIASRMDGARPYDEVATWARERLGIQPSASDLAEYARKLSGLGFFDASAADSGKFDSNFDYTPLPESVPADAADEEDRFEGERTQQVPAAEVAAAAARMADEVRAREAAVIVPVEAPAPVAPSFTDAPRTDPNLAPPPAPSRIREELAEKTVPERPARKSAASLSALVGVLTLVGAGLAYFQFVANAPIKVTVMVASPREVVRLYDGQAPVKQAEPQSLSFGEAGKVTDAVAVGTEVQAGAPLATLEAYAKIEKDMTDVKDRAAFYEKQMAAAVAKNNTDAAKAAEAKVAEKKKLLADLEARVPRVRLVAPSSGVVSEVLVPVGGDAKPDAPAVRISDKRLTIDFKVPAADAATLKAGGDVTMQAAAGGAPVAGKITKVEGDTVSIELGAGATPKAGQALRLVRSRIANVIQVPASAVVKREGADIVFVLSNGEAKARKITIVDRTPAEALVSSGLATGDSVIKSSVELLKDGQKAVTQ